jgi:TPR repeat protein
MKIGHSERSRLMRIFEYLLTGAAVALGCFPAYAQKPNAIFYRASVSNDQQLAAKGNLSAHMRLGYRYLTGSTGAVDTQQAAQHFAAVANSGSSAASAWLGYSYVTAPELGHHASDGIAMIRKASGTGDPVAQTVLGHVLDWGIGVPTDHATARTLFAAAAPKFALAQRYLGESYLRSKSRSDLAAAATWLGSASALGDRSAMLDLAGMYAQRLGQPQSIKAALYWLRKAAETNDPAAIFQQGYFYRHVPGKLANPKKAIALYTSAATAGYVPAQSALGMCYAKGLGVPQNTQEAIKWLSMAAPKSSFAAKQLAILRGH